MPQHPNQQRKKKKKGHTPAHQNSFKFAHNPKSKKTAAILASPISHVCRRCHDKLEWRKQYRKYKPRKTEGKCNHCQRRHVVKAAYHTICESCTRTSPQSRKLLEAWNTSTITSPNKDAVREQTEGRTDPSVIEAHANGEQSRVEEGSTSCVRCHRVCAMCTKEPALPDEDDHDDSHAVDTGGRRLQLRERKALERAKLRASSKNQHAVAKEVDDNEEVVANESDTCVNNSVQDEEEEDPFLKAVGGADKLVTGEAYQELLLEKEETRGR